MKIIAEPQWVGGDGSQGKLDIALRPAGNTWQVPNTVSSWQTLRDQLSMTVIALVGESSLVEWNAAWCRSCSRISSPLRSLIPNGRETVARLRGG